MYKKSVVKQAGLHLLILGLVAGCTCAPPEPPKQQAAAQPACSETAKAEAADAIKAAQQAIGQTTAASAQLWRDTEDMLKQADTLVKACETGKAISLARQAQRQAEAALAQHRSEQARLAPLLK